MNPRGTTRSYVIGYLSAVALTVLAALLVFIHDWSDHTVFSHPFLRTAVVILAFAQLVLQLIFFLHLGSETGPRWKLMAFLMTFALVLIVVVASIWIMNHLNYNMTPADVNQYLQIQQGGF